MHNLKRNKKKLWNHYFSAVIWLWLFSNQSQMWQKPKKGITNCAHWCFWCPSIRFSFKSLTGDVSKKTPFFYGFLRLFAFAFKPLFSCVGLSFCWVWISVFFFFPCCCCFTNQVAMFWFLFFVVFGVSWVCLCVMLLCFFGFVFGFFLFFFGGVEVAQNGHLSWP